MKRLLLSLTVLLLLVSTGFGQEPRGPNPSDTPRHPRRPAMREKLKLLDLTKEQRTKMENLRSEFEKKVIPLRADIELKQIDLRSEMKADSPNEQKILKLAREINDIEFQIKELEIKQQLAIRSVLTPEQREKLREPAPPSENPENEEK